MRPFGANFYELHALQYADEEDVDMLADATAAARQEDAEGAEAYGRMFERFAAPLYRFAERKGVQGQDADDIVSEAILLGWRHRLKIRQPELFQGWLYRITGRLIINRHRKQQKDTDTISDDFFWENVEGGYLDRPDAELSFEEEIARARDTAYEIVSRQSDELRISTEARFYTGARVRNPRAVAKMIGTSGEETSQWLVDLVDAEGHYYFVQGAKGNSRFIAQKPIGNAAVAELLGDNESSVKRRTWTVNEAVKDECDGIGLEIITRLRSPRLALRPSDQLHAAPHGHLSHEGGAHIPAPYGLETRRQSPYSAQQSGQLSGGLGTPQSLRISRRKAK